MNTLLLTGPLLLMFLFMVKHLICDFFLQPPWMWQNKGKYGHLGGITHAVITITGSAIAIGIFSYWIAGIFFTSYAIFFVLLIEYLIHYHMDWFKIWICKKQNWIMTKDKEFWYMLGTDQFVHILTNIWMVYYLFGAIT